MHNDFTYISSRGSSVVDYCVIPYEALDSFSNFNVIRTSALIENTNAVGNYDLTRISPDHSLLTWDLTLNFRCDLPTDNIPKTSRNTKTKYDTRNIPDDWLCTESAISEITRIIEILENSEATQCNLYHMYEQFVNTIKTEMSSKLQSKTVFIHDGVSNKRRRCKKPWWNEELTILWNEVCELEKLWLKCSIRNQKKECRRAYVNKRKIFDKVVQKSKRKYWYVLQDELRNSCENPMEFWRKIGKIGVGNERQNNIPMDFHTNFVIHQIGRAHV